MRRLSLLLLATFALSLAALAQQRFDDKVRSDMFAGFDGNRASLDRAMQLLESTLAAEPDHAEALIWRGAGRLFLSGEAFTMNAFDVGQRLSNQGLADLERAYRLRPEAIGVRAARAPALLPFARGLRPFNQAEADRLTATAIGDFEFVMAASNWDTLGGHARGELLGGLATAWLDLGQPAKAMPYLDRMVGELAGSPYAANAALRRADPSARTPLTCLGCH